MNLYFTERLSIRIYYCISAVNNEAGRVVFIDRAHRDHASICQMDIINPPTVRTPDKPASPARVKAQPRWLGVTAYPAQGVPAYPTHAVPREDYRRARISRLICRHTVGHPSIACLMPGGVSVRSASTRPTSS